MCPDGAATGEFEASVIRHPAAWVYAALGGRVFTSATEPSRIFSDICDASLETGSLWVWPARVTGALCECKPRTTLLCSSAWYRESKVGG